jgi:pimeloyl-ACP methyl ester carboxylesterase
VKNFLLNHSHGTVNWFRKQGLDWHGPSVKDVWSTLEALVSILHKNSWRLSSCWLISANSSVVVVGHSNGGQGAWYLASHFPDRVVAGTECC